MASSARSRPSTASARQHRGPTPLPSYQPPQHPLNESAQRALQNLSRDHKLDSLKTRLKAANSHLTTAAADVNERLQMRNAQYEKQKKRLEKQGSQEDNEQDTMIANARQEADEVTGKLETGIRMIIDSNAEVGHVERALKELQENVTEGRGSILPTQSTLGASQFRSRNGRRRREADVDEATSDLEDDTFDGETENALGMLKQKIADQHSSYKKLSMAQRYATHNDYVGFKRIVHDAQYPEDQAPPLPNASTWFPSDSPDPTNPNARTGAVGGNDPVVDDDEDLVVASERISIKCPLTLLPMKDPVTSQRCQHSFEKEAILSMINASDVRTGGSGRRGVQDGQKAMQCPLCAMLLTASDLKENPALVRKIKRIQAAQNARNEGFSDDEDDSRQRKSSIFGNGNRPEEVSSSPAATRTPKFKSERRSVAPGRQSRQVSMVPNSQVERLVNEDQRSPSSSAATDVVDLEDAEDEDEDE